MIGCPLRSTTPTLRRTTEVSTLMVSSSCARAAPAGTSTDSSKMGNNNKRFIRRKMVAVGRQPREPGLHVALAGKTLTEYAFWAIIGHDSFDRANAEMFFRPSFCANCGERIERSDWGL